MLQNYKLHLTKPNFYSKSFQNNLIIIHPTSFLYIPQELYAIPPNTDNDKPALRVCQCMFSVPQVFRCEFPAPPNSGQVRSYDYL